MKVTKTFDVPKELLKIVAESYFTTEAQFERQLRPATQLYLFATYINILTKKEYKCQWQLVVKNFIRKYAGTYGHSAIVEDHDHVRLECFNILGDFSRDGVYVAVHNDQIEYGRIQSVLGVTSLVPQHEL